MRKLHPDELERTISLMRGTFNVLDSSIHGLMLAVTTFSSNATTVGGRVAGEGVITGGAGGGGGGGGGGGATGAIGELTAGTAGTGPIPGCEAAISSSRDVAASNLCTNKA
jgi:hypothetical protein